MPEFVADRELAARAARARRGADLCREALAEADTERGLARVATEPAAELTDSDAILDRARRRAAADRQAARRAS
jgi:hypothetical protein